MAPGPSAGHRPPEYPRLAFLLTFVGGAFILVVGALLVINILAMGSIGSLAPSGWAAVLGLGGIADGVALAIVALLLRWEPRRYPLWGTLTIFLAILSLVVAAGGLIVGFGLAMIGGIGTLAWRPSWEPSERSADRPRGRRRA